MSSQSPEVVMHTYVQAYEKLYKRRPSDLRILDANWVIVNGARMRIADLERLTKQIQTEYKQSLEKRRSVVSRLINWLKS